eukprot:429579_1
MNVLIAVIFSVLYAFSNAYQLGEYITCWEQNDVDPVGFTDPLWSDDNSDECKANPDLCDIYQSDPNKNKGDVCDHEDPNTKQLRDFCFFQVRFGEEEDDEKTWSYKCWGGDCPNTDQNGNIMTGCAVTENRVTCCCNDTDYCNGQDLYLKYAQWGLAENYPPKMDEICNYADDYGDYCPSDNQNEDEQGEDEDGDENQKGGGGGGNNGNKANAVIGADITDSNDDFDEKYIILLFTYFMIALVSACIGFYVGNKVSNARLRQYYVVDKAE